MSRRCRCGFTLIELLVVIAIIALLVSILVPSLRKARDVARTAVCLANMKNIGQAYLFYSSENHGHIVPLMAQNAETNRWAQEASGLSDGAWAANQAGFTGGSGGRGWAVVLWPYYRSLELMTCPADPHRDLTTEARGGAPISGYEAYTGARRQSYLRHSSTVVCQHEGWHVDWSTDQVNMFRFSKPAGGYYETRPLDQVTRVHGVPAAELVWLMELGFTRQTSGFWGGFYGAWGGGRVLLPIPNSTPAEQSRQHGVYCAVTGETHPRGPLGIDGYDDPDGGSNYGYLDGHAENRMDFPDQRAIGCAFSP